jgi:hypothetical protein
MKRVDRLSRSSIAPAARRRLMRCWSGWTSVSARWARFWGVSICVAMAASASQPQPAAEVRSLRLAC